MRMLLIDDHTLFRNGLKFLLSDLDAQLEFVEADGIRGIAPDDGASPIDLALLDLHLPGASGVDALAALRALLPDTTVVIVTGDEDPMLIRDCIDAGAAGFIPKSSTPQVLITALRLVLAGGTYLPPHVLGASPQVAPSLPNGRPDNGNGNGNGQREPTTPVDRLTGRQFDVLMLAIRGKSNKVIARELDLSEGTVKQHLSAAFRTLGVNNRTEAVFVAAELGLGGPR